MAASSCLQDLVLEDDSLVEAAAGVAKMGAISTSGGSSTRQVMMGATHATSGGPSRRQVMSWQCSSHNWRNDGRRRKGFAVSMVYHYGQEKPTRVWGFSISLLVLPFGARKR